MVLVSVATEVLPPGASRVYGLSNVVPSAVSIQLRWGMIPGCDFDLDRRHSGRTRWSEPGKWRSSAKNFSNKLMSGIAI
jgi:hypothetical protein